MSSFLEKKLPKPIKRRDAYRKKTELLFFILFGMNLKTQSFTAYEDWMRIKIFYIKRK